MSRSKRRTPVFGYTTATTEKLDKRFANRRLRHKVKQKMQSENELFPLIREVSNVWSFCKDGKHYVKPNQWGVEALKKAMRK